MLGFIVRGGEVVLTVELSWPGLTHSPPGDFAEKRVLMLFEQFYGHFGAIKS